MGESIRGKKGRLPSIELLRQASGHLVARLIAVKNTSAMNFFLLTIGQQLRCCDYWL